MTTRRHLRGLLLAAPLLGAVFVSACGRAPVTPHWGNFGGDAKAGKTLFVRYGCGSCHTLDASPNSNGLVGPPLAGFHARTMIAGMLPNTPENLVLWLRYPQQVTPGNAMPNVGLSDREARDVAAYLYKLR